MAGEDKAAPSGAARPSKGEERESGALAADQTLVEAGAGVRTELERENVEEADPHQRDESEEDCHASIIGLCVLSLYALLTRQSVGFPYRPLKGRGP